MSCALADPLDRQSRGMTRVATSNVARASTGGGAPTSPVQGRGVTAPLAHHRREAEGIDDGSHPARRPGR